MLLTADAVLPGPSSQFLPSESEAPPSNSDVTISAPVVHRERPLHRIRPKSPANARGNSGESRRRRGEVPPGTTICGVGELLDELTIPAEDGGHHRLLVWAQGLNAGKSRRFALEDCRGVNGRLERFLLEAGEHVLRVPPKLMANARKGGREDGKSDALAVALHDIDPDLEPATRTWTARPCDAVLLSASPAVSRPLR